MWKRFRMGELIGCTFAEILETELRIKMGDEL